VDAWKGEKNYKGRGNYPYIIFGKDAYIF